MMNTIYALLAHSWSGLVIAAIVAGLGWLIVYAARWLGYPRARFVGYAVYGLAGLLALGSMVAIVRISRAQRRYPPMGKLVDVGGYRMHILAEGDAKGGPTLVWIPGSHAPGLALYHLHKVMRNETRSILFDRPGTGWSDTGPFPRRTAREAEELQMLLDNAGEKGPFILIGHSYGGLLAANYARRYLEKTAAVILLDATPPDVFLYLPGGGGEALPAGLVRDSQWQGLSKLFGVWSDPARRMARSNEETEVRKAMQAISAGPVSDWAHASIISEWFDPKSVAELMVYDGELGDLPVFVVIPEGDIDGTIGQLHLNEADRKRALNFLARARVRYLSTSSKSELIHPPAGTGHNYPYEAPDFVVETVRRVLAESRQRF
ncbi:MAG: alpha/beta fold hydrolase, partial [Pyrinomonadaceae bacterium]